MQMQPGVRVRLHIVGVLLLFTGTAVSDAQTVGGLGFLGQSSATVFSIDPATGEATPLLATGSSGIAEVSPAVDPAGRRVFFESGTDLYTANLASGSVAHVPFPNCCVPLVYDTQANVLLGLGFANGGSQVSVFSINLATGAATPLLNTGASSIAEVDVAFDPATRRLFFESSTNLYTVNLAGGTVSQVPFAACCIPLEYDTQANRLLGVGFLAGSSSVLLVDPMTGVATPLVPLGAPGIAEVSIALNPATRQLYFESGTDIYTANLTNGTVSHVPLPICCLPLFTLPAGTTASVPDLSTVSLAILIIGLAVAGWRLLIRNSA